MAKRKKHHAKRHHKSGKHHPTAKAKKAYYKNIVKAYHRLHKVVKQHAPGELE